MSAEPERQAPPGARAIVWLCKRVLWRWPMVPAMGLGRVIVATPACALRFAGPIAILVASIAAARIGVRHGLWGDSVAHAWHREQVARKNVETIRTFLRDHAREQPERAHDWQKRSYGIEEYERRKRARSEWEGKKRHAEQLLASNQAAVPSVLSLRAPDVLEVGTPLFWALLYHLDHTLFGMIYAPIIAFYTILGIIVAWRGADPRTARRWRRALARQSEDRVLLGLDADGGAHYLGEAQRSQHLLVTGASGFGKTQALIQLVAADIAAGRGLVFVDLKGDRHLAHTFYEMSARVGRGSDYRFFSFEPGSSDSYNPIAFGDALARTDRTFSVGTFGSEEHYRVLSREALLRVLSAMDRHGGALTFADLVHALFDREGYRLVSSWAAPDDRRQFEEDLANWDAFQNAVSGLRANLKTFASDALRARLCQPRASIDLTRAHAGKHIVYFELNSQMRPDAARGLARLVLEDVKGLAGALAASPDRRKPFHVYIDEAGRALYPGLAELISQCRSADIGLVLATQSPRDFDGQEVKVMTQVLQNTATKIILRQPDPESASLCAELGGTRETTNRTCQMVDDGLVMGVNSSGVYSDRNVHEFLVHPSSLKNLGVGSAFILLSDGARKVVQMPYRPFRLRRPFEPCRPREEEADAPRPLDLAGLLRGAPVAAPASKTAPQPAAATSSIKWAFPARRRHAGAAKSSGGGAT